MPFPRPSLSQLIQQVKQNIVAALPGADALLRFSNLGVLGAVQAGMAHQHYGYLDYIAQQATPYTATDEYLAAWGALKSVLQKPATQAAGTVTFPSTGGTLNIPAGTPLTRADGVMYTVQSVTQTTSTSIIVSVIADADPAGLTGAFGNCVAGTSFSLGQSFANINSSGTSSAITGGADLETQEAYRQRVISAYQQVAQGGAQNDYVQWALAVPGVTRAWCVPLLYGAGTVGVYVMLDSTRAANSGLPQGTNGVAALETRDTAATGDQLIVANALYPLRPVTALVYVLAPTLTPVNISLQGVAAANRSAVQKSLETMMYSVQNIATALQVRQIWNAVQQAAPNDDFIVLSPTADVPMSTGCLPVLGTITWS